MMSQRLLGNLEEGWLQPTLAALFQNWWYLIVLSVLVSTVLLWMAGQLIKTDMELRRAVRAMAQEGGQGGSGAEHRLVSDPAPGHHQADPASRAGFVLRRLSGAEILVRAGIARAHDL